MRGAPGPPRGPPSGPAPWAAPVAGPGADPHIRAVFPYPGPVPPTPPSPPSALSRNLLLRTAVYYAVLALAIWLLPPQDVGGLGVLSGDALPFAADAKPSKDALAAAAAAGSGGPGAFPTAVAMTAAFLLALPVCWVYIHSRGKKGYQQSVVQTMLILPVLVAGIVVLVKHSLPLAFALGGIVAAVRFRTSLDDSKDAAAILAVTGIGLASAVDPAIAAVLSVGFNALIVGLWVSDFGEAPPEFDGKKAKEKLERVRLQMGRTGTFVARVDDELLKAMTPAQLEALAEKAWKRRKRQDPNLDDDTPPPNAFSTLLRVRAADPDALRAALEPRLGEWFAQSKFLGSVRRAEDDTRFVEWGVDFAPGVTPAIAATMIRALPDVPVLDVELR